MIELTPPQRQAVHASDSGFALSTRGFLFTKGNNSREIAPTIACHSTKLSVSRCQQPRKPRKRADFMPVESAKRKSEPTQLLLSEGRCCAIFPKVILRSSCKRTISTSRSVFL